MTGVMPVGVTATAAVAAAGTGAHDGASHDCVQQEEGTRLTSGGSPMGDLGTQDTVQGATTIIAATMTVMTAATMAAMMTVMMVATIPYSNNGRTKQPVLKRR